MDKISRRYNKVNKEEKITKRPMKCKEKCEKSKIHQLLLDFKQTKHLPRKGQNPGKITSGRVTVSSYFSLF